MNGSTSTLEVSGAESRALISGATSLAAFRLGDGGLGPILGLGCIPPLRCVQLGPDDQALAEALTGHH